MNTAFFSQQLSCWLSITVIALLGSELSARAQTPNSNSTESSAKPAIVSPQQTGTPFLIKNSYPEQKAASSTSAPLPGASATSASTLTPDSVKPAATATFGVAQNNTVPTPSPSVVPNPGTNSTPAVPVQVTPAPATPGVPSGAPNFSDVGEDYWAYPFIQTLATKNIIIGFPDGTFRPDKPVSRAEFAAMLQKAFHPQPIRQLSPTGFSDVPADYWGAAAIKSAYEGGYLAGYPNNLFLPNQKIIRVQAIAGLASGLGLSHTAAAADVLNTYYTDAGQVPIYAVNNVAAATQAHLVVNYPDVKTLNPRTPLTRAEAVAHLYQALVHLGQIPPLASNIAAASYIVGGPTSVSQAPITPAPAPSSNPTPATRPGDYSYIGGAVNFGLQGSRALGNTNFTVISKIRLLKNLPISLRPAAVIGGNTNFLIPVTYDFAIPSLNAFGHRFPITPYLGGGLIIPSNNGGDLGPLISAGVDYPLSRQLTATLGFNTGWVGGNAQIGLWLGVGYNFGFRGF